MADFYAARAGTNAGAPLDGFLTAVHTVVWLTLANAAPLIALAGVGELDLLLRVCLVFVVLGLFERLAQRLLVHRHTT